MRNVCYIVGAIASAIYYLHFMPQDDPYFVQQIFKVIPMLFIILLSYRFHDFQQERYSHAMTIALVWITLGNITLPYLFISLVCFALGQLYFLRAFFTISWKTPPKWLLPLIVVFAAVVIGWVVGNILKDHLYLLALVISMYIAITLTTLWASFHTRQWTIISATLCFVAANLFFAIDNFITTLPNLSIIMMTPYYCANLLFSLSIVKYFGLPNKVVE
jgi:uncharacterized membrane protein YhhN